MNFETAVNFNEPSMVIALALAAGMLAQSLARHLGVPGIVLLIGTGILLGPDMVDVVRPSAVRGTLEALVGFAVAVILFEGGLNLNVRRLRREAKSIRRLVTTGAVTTFLGGAAAARIVLGWEWNRSVLFGTLVIVTGPTVINPLLRRLRLQRRLATVLEAEGVLIDPIGAIIAVVALEVVLRPTGQNLAMASLHLLANLGFGVIFGLAAGGCIALLLRLEYLVPEGFENVVTLSLVLFAFQLSNSLVRESGILAVAVAGLVVGNVRTRVLGELKDFKEQLTVMLIGLMFVLLAADVRLDDLRSLGWRGAMTVLTLMLLVRPLNVALSTAGSDLGWREKAVLSWLCPRGIIAAAVSSFFAQELAAAGMEGGEELRALVFLVIAVTVLLQGLTGGPLASLLKVRRPSKCGYVILGANPLGQVLGTLLADTGSEVLFIDASPDACRTAEESGMRIIYGSGLSERVQLRADLPGRAGCIAVTPNDAVNFAFARKAREDYRVPDVWVGLRHEHLSVTVPMVRETGCRVLFGHSRNLTLWASRLERGVALPERWRFTSKATGRQEADFAEAKGFLLPVAWVKGRRIMPVDEMTVPSKETLWHFVVLQERRCEAVSWLEAHGWSPCQASAAT